MARTPKKSESLEIRIPYETKQAFMDRCRADGVSASEALRGFIDTRLAPPARPARVWVRAGLAAVAALGVAATALPSLAGQAGDFQRLDRDASGAISRAEFARLDRDGDGVVTAAEFRR